MAKIRVVAVRHGKKDKPDPSRATTTWALKSRLTEPGIEIARRVGQQLVEKLGKNFSVVTSPLVRAQETAFEILMACGIAPEDFDAHMRYDSGLWSGQPSIWFLSCDPAQYSNAAVYAVLPEAVEQEGQRVLNAIVHAANTAESVGQDVVVCVSHGGPLDAAIMVARLDLGQEVTIKDLNEGEGAIFTIEDGEIVDVEDFLQAPAV